MDRPPDREAGPCATNHVDDSGSDRLLQSEKSYGDGAWHRAPARTVSS